MESRLHLQCVSGDERPVCVASWDCTNNDQERNEACKNKHKGVESAILKTSYSSLLVWLRLLSTTNYMNWKYCIRCIKRNNIIFLFCNCLILRLCTVLILL